MGEILGLAGIGDQLGAADLLPLGDPAVYIACPLLRGLDHGDGDSGELPFVAALQLEAHSGELLHALQRHDELDGTALAQTVFIREIVHVPRPFAVEHPDVFPHIVRGAHDLLVLDADVAELDLEIRFGARVAHVVGGDGHQVALEPVHGLEDQVFAVGLQGEVFIRVAPGSRVDADALDAGRGAVFDGVVVSGDIAGADGGSVKAGAGGRRVVDRDAGVADGVGLAQDLSGFPFGLGSGRPGDRDLGKARFRGRRGFAQDDPDAGDLPVIGEHGRNCKAVALLGKAGYGDIAHLFHDGSQGIDGKRKDDVPAGAEDVDVSYLKGRRLAEAQIGDLGHAARGV